MSDMFRYDNPFLTTLCKIGDLFVLSILWLICCLPVITLIPASSALYYVVVKSIRRERGSAIKQFWAAFRQNLMCGVKVTLVYVLFAAVTLMWFLFAAKFSLDTLEGMIYTAISRILLMVFGLCSSFLTPLTARFYMKAMQYWKHSFFLGFRHLGWSFLMLLGTIGTSILIILLPPLVVILPAVLALVLSFIIEPVLARYTIVSDEQGGKDIWFDHSAS